MKKIKEFIKKIMKRLNSESLQKYAELKKRIKELAEHLGYMHNDLYRLDRTIYNQNLFKKDFELLKQDKSKNKILVAGFFGALNTGDELMLEAMLNYLKDKPNVYVMLSNNENLIPKFNYDFKYIHYANNMYECEMIAEEFDTVIWAGGAHIDDNNYDREPLSFAKMYSAISINMIKNNKKVITYGFSSIKNLSNANYKKHLKYIIDNSLYFSVRDELSKKTVEDFCKPKASINVDDDLVFGLESLATVKKADKENNKIVMINIYSENNYNQIKMLVEQVLKETDKKYTIELLEFYNYHDNDKTYINRIIDELADERLKYVSLKVKSQELVNYLKDASLIVSMRYHGILLANILNVRTVAVLYDIHDHYYNKVTAMYDKYNFNMHKIKYSDISTNNYDEFQKILDTKESIVDCKAVFEKTKQKLETITKKI